MSTVQDDFSRYVIARELCTTMKTTDVTDTLNTALKAYGNRGAVQFRESTINPLRIDWLSRTQSRSRAVIRNLKKFRRSLIYRQTPIVTSLSFCNIPALSRGLPEALRTRADGLRNFNLVVRVVMPIVLQQRW